MFGPFLLLVVVEIGILFFIVFILPALLTILVILKLLHFSRFKLNKVPLMVLLVMWVLSVSFTTYRFIAPRVSDKQSANAVTTQAQLFVAKAQYPILLSRLPSAKYQIENLKWYVFLDSHTSFSEEPLTNTSDPYFQPAQGKCDAGSLKDSQPTTNENPYYLQCTLVARLNNGLEIYQQNSTPPGTGLMFGLYKGLLLEFGDNTNTSLLSSIYIPTKSEVLSAVKSSQFNSNYDDALNRWYNQQEYGTCKVPENDCPFHT